MDVELLKPLDRKGIDVPPRKCPRFAARDVQRLPLIQLRPRLHVMRNQAIPFVRIERRRPSWLITEALAIRALRHAC
jgi:hypothetical protein